MNKTLLFFTFLLIIFYLLNKININTLIKKILFFFTTKEDFLNKFIPNRFFKYKNKIYLLDTNSILENDKNPLVFENVYEFKKFLENVKNTDDSDFNFIKNQLNKKKIQELPKKYNIKNEDNFFNENQDYKCNKFAAKCSFIKKDKLNNKDIYRKNQLNNIEKECKKSIISQDKCEKLGQLLKESDKYENQCNKNPDDKLCKNLNIIKHNKKFIENNCIDIPYFEKEFDDFKKICLFEDFFKENMLSYDF